MPIGACNGVASLSISPSMSRLHERAHLPRSPRLQQWLVWTTSGTAIAGGAAGILLENWWLGAAPAAVLILWLAVFDFRRLYYLLLATLPLSTEIELPAGLGTDLPSEQIMWLLTLVGVAWFAYHSRSVDARFVRHPVTLALLAHLSWTTLACLNSTMGVASLKFWLAKGWYVVVFFFLAGHIFRQERDFKALLWWFLIPLLLTVCIVLARHAARGLTFEEVNYVMGPFYRNHVIYACIQAVFLPFVWWGRSHYPPGSWSRRLLTAAMLLLLVGINFAYTRAAYGALLIAVVFYGLMRWRMLQVGLLIAALGIGLFVSFVTYRDNWLLFAPNYERTVTHTRFDNLLQATTRLEDISLMERVYRWVAAAYMIEQKPILGFGPGTFYFNYRNFTVTSFKTYVSHNPERSGIHNYYLMVAVEQGLPGLFFFLAFCVLVLLWGQRTYHRLREVAQGRFVMAASLSFALICLLMFMNDFVETDKIGSLFFICAAIVVNGSLSAQASKEKSGKRSEDVLPPSPF